MLKHPKRQPGTPASAPKNPTQEQVDYSKGMGFQEDANALSAMYSKWSMIAEAQLLSRTAEGETPRTEEEILGCMGRGQRYGRRVV